MNFIIYEDQRKYIDIYRKTILRLMGDNNINYKIIEINNTYPHITNFSKSSEKLFSK